MATQYRRDPFDLPIANLSPKYRHTRRQDLLAARPRGTSRSWLRRLAKNNGWPTVSHEGSLTLEEPEAILGNGPWTRTRPGRPKLLGPTSHVVALCGLQLGPCLPGCPPVRLHLWICHPPAVGPLTHSCLVCPSRYTPERVMKPTSAFRRSRLPLRAHQIIRSFSPASRRPTTLRPGLLAASKPRAHPGSTYIITPAATSVSLKSAGWLPPLGFGLRSRKCSI